MTSSTQCVQSGNQLTAFYDTLLGGLVGATPLAQIKAQCSSNCIITDPLFWDVCVVAAGNVAGCAEVLAALCATWSHATAIGPSNIAALGKLSTPSVQFACSRICAGATAMSSPNNVVLVAESVSALKLANKFLAGHIRKAASPGALRAYVREWAHFNVTDAIEVPRGGLGAWLALDPAVSRWLLSSCRVLRRAVESCTCATCPNSMHTHQHAVGADKVPCDVRPPLLDTLSWMARMEQLSMHASDAPAPADVTSLVLHACAQKVTTSLITCNRSARCCWWLS